MPKRLVIIGGDAAGMSAATQARRRQPPDALEIVVFEQSSYVSYAACGEPYYVSGEIAKLEKLIVRTPAAFAAMAITVHLQHEVVAIDTQAGTIQVRDKKQNKEVTYHYDDLLYATGSTPIIPQIDGIHLQRVQVMHTLDDARTVKRLVKSTMQEVVIVGGGYIGLEMAEAFLFQGLITHVITRDRTVLANTLDPEMSQQVMEEMRTMGIALYPESEVTHLEGKDGKVTHVHTTCGKRLKADLVLFAAGTKPAVRLAQEAGISLGESGAIRVNPRQQTSIAGVWAAGDCTEALHRVSQRPVNFHLGTIANKQGRIAGINLGGDYATFPGVLGSSITKIGDLEIASTGLTEESVMAAGLQCVTATTESTTRAGYWPETQSMHLKVLAERGSGRLLGAQILGGAGAAKRIDVFAAALWNAMRVEDMLSMDLAYAPPFSSVWDPVLIATRKAWEALHQPTSTPAFPGC